MSLRPAFLALSLAFTFSLPAAAKAPAKASKPAASKAAPSEPTLAHNLSDEQAARLAELIERFREQSGQNIKLMRLEKDDKPATLNLINRYQMSDTLSQPKDFVPLHSMMSKAGQKLSLSLPEVLRPGVTDARGQVVALPVIYSTPVLFYNKNALRKAGLDPEAPPKTWFEMQGVLDKLQAAGYDCPYSTSWPAWVHLDNVSAVSGTPAVDNKGNLKFNALPQVKHVAMMATWTKARYFRLFGNTNEASQQFRDGHCAMLTTDSREYANFQDARGVELGVAPMPFHDDVFGGRRPSLANGPSLWIGAGKPAAEYKVAAQFVSFLLSPKIQVELVRQYGGLPLTDAARKAAASELLQDGRQMLEAAYLSLQGKSDDPGTRLVNIDRARLIADEELNEVWTDKKPAKAALDTAVARGNSVLNAHPLLKKSQPF
ncbi:extracellular solute-binding protein [Azonexus sp.]|uniref:extracellular solute-binding protein n=1 Tax=Azonexus sp. TaxID=1872668 RepID=UPI0039E272CC